MLKISLKAARTNAGFSQKEAAKRLQISNNTLCRWEKGTAFPDVCQIDQLCNLYGVSYDNLNFLPNNSL